MTATEYRIFKHAYMYSYNKENQHMTQLVYPEGTGLKFIAEQTRLKSNNQPTKKISQNHLNLYLVVKLNRWF